MIKFLRLLMRVNKDREAEEFLKLHTTRDVKPIVELFEKQPMQDVIALMTIRMKVQDKDFREFPTELLSFIGKLKREIELMENM